MKYLQVEEYIHFAPTEVGKVRVNHSSEGCSGGRESMIVSRAEDGSVSAQCFRCGRWGRWTPEFHRTKTAIAKIATSTTVKERFHLPSDVEYDITKWPRSLRVWVSMAISDAEARHYRFGYSACKDALIMPIDCDNFILRINNHTYNKYLSYIINNNIYKYTYKNNTLVIVEDYLSFIKMSRWFSCLCLFGTSMNNKALLEVTSKHNEFVLFLDNDNSIVKKKQSAIAKRLRMFGGVKVVKSDKDPKHLSKEEAQELVWK